MSYFNEDQEYWGNQTVPLIGASNGRLTARSVKIFADGTYSHDVIFSHIWFVICSIYDFQEHCEQEVHR
jgi:hypothetical protein